MQSSSLPSAFQQPLPSNRHWGRAGTEKRAGVLAPLFCLHSKASVGIGEIPDLELLADWCIKTGLSIIQILPLNDTGWNFRPYDSQSAFAIDPMYLRIRSLLDAAVKPFEKKIAKLEKDFENPGRFVNYAIKARKLELLWEIFQHLDTEKKSVTFKNFCRIEKSWLGAYAAFKVFKQLNHEKPWWDWPAQIRGYDAQVVGKELAGLEESVLFHQWLAWQAAEQLQATAIRIRARNILIMADMPFLVARDSADVWMNPRFFKLDREAGAPPDLYIAEGQRWGMPPYRWEEIEADHFKYIKERIRFLSRYAHLYRIDHFVGLCRLWTIDAAEPQATHGRNGVFDPADPSLWKMQAQKIVSAMLEAADILPCAEDLGVVPDCAHEILNEFQIPGSDVQRWMRDWKGDQKFLSPDQYRYLSVSSISTHDMPSFPLWWCNEASPDEKKYLLDWVEMPPQFSEGQFVELLERLFFKTLEARSVFSIHAVQEWLALTGHTEFFKPDHQINKPGTVHAGNWSIRLPFSLEQMLALPINATIQKLVQSSGRKV